MGIFWILAKSCHQKQQVMSFMPYPSIAPKWFGPIEGSYYTYCLFLLFLFEKMYDGFLLFIRWKKYKRENICCKVHIFWGATNFCEISTVDLSYVVTVKFTLEISQTFVAFSEYMNFNIYKTDKMEKENCRR